MKIIFDEEHNIPFDDEEEDAIEDSSIRESGMSFRMKAIFQILFY